MPSERNAFAVNDDFESERAEVAIRNKNKEYVIRLIFAQMQAMTLRAALHIHLFDVLHGEWLSVEQISSRSPERPPTRFLPELCDTLGAMNLIAKRTDVHGVVYETIEGSSYNLIHNRLADVYSNRHSVDKYCREESEYSVRNLCRMNAELSDPLVTRIRSSVTHGTRDLNTNETTENNTKIRELFQKTITEVNNTSKHLVKSLDLSRFRTFIDLGGGNGIYARFVKEAFPNLTISVLEMPKVVELAISLDENKTGNINFISGDFFKPLPKADVFSLCHILHNWSDAECDTILRNVMKALLPGGAIIIMESILNEDRVGPLKANLTEVTQIRLHIGNHRTLVGVKTILRRNCFIKIQHFKATQFSFYDCIIAYKP